MRHINIKYYLCIFILLNFKINTQNNLPDGFVYLSDIDDTIYQDIRYASNHNFVGRPIKGYEKNVCILTKEAAFALSKVQKELKQIYGINFSLKVYDAYRPTKEM
ncbi:MAG: M15 family metallopeptidase [Bacteroidetes bacterium]|nr:M15 family metallopeptidase [Bacteroidota bacterium]